MKNKKGQHMASPKQNNQDKYNAPLETRIAQALTKLTGRPRRLVSFLAAHDTRSTAVIANICAIGNVSDAAIHANLVIWNYGLEIENFPPEKPFINRFGQRTQMHLWRLVDKGASK